MKRISEELRYTIKIMQLAGFTRAEIYKLLRQKAGVQISQKSVYIIANEDRTDVRR